MITATSLQHPMLHARLDNAMRKAAAQSRVYGFGLAHIAGIDVVHLRKEPRAFRFFDARDNEITSTVISALRGRGILMEIAA